MSSEKKRLDIYENGQGFSYSKELIYIPKSEELEKLKISVGEKYFKDFLEMVKKEQIHRHEIEKNSENALNLSLNKDYYLEKLKILS